MSGNTVSGMRAAGPGMRERQLASILATELKKSFLSARSLVTYGLAAMPVALFASVSLFAEQPIELAEIPVVYGHIHQLFLLRLVIFMGCAWIFTNLFRAEILDRSLHYYFLMPIRRELIVAGKYIAGLLGAIVLFGASTVLAMLALYIGHSSKLVVNHLLQGSGLQMMVDYLGMSALACVGYGSFFLIAGLLFRNPFIPAIVLWGWEAINFLLPALLKNLSVIHHLQALSPIPIEAGPFGILSEPGSPMAAVLGLTVVSAMFLILAAARLRTFEISYGID